MPTDPKKPSNRTLKALGVAVSAFLFLGLYCSEKPDPPSLPSAILTDIRLTMAESSTGAPGVRLSWTYPEESRVSYFNVYASPDKDSMGTAILTEQSADSMQALLPLPDSTRPFTHYFAVSAVYVEATGQKIRGDTLVVDSLTVKPSLEILSPAPGKYLSGRTLDMEVLTTGDDGVLLRMGVFMKPERFWIPVLDTCLPLTGCQTPILGRSLQKDSVVLEQLGEGDTTQTMFCVIGTESFEGARTGLLQSLGCSRFFRVGD